MSRRGGSQSLDFELNLAPIIDAFTVLITFMLASASFLSISVFDAGFAPAEAVGDPSPPPITITVNVKKAGSFELNLKGHTNSNKTFPNVDALMEELKSVKAKYPTVLSITLSADDKVEYESVVQAMEKIRAPYPSVVLGGF